MANLMDSIRRDVPELMRSYDPEALATMISESRAATAPTSGETRTARESGSMQGPVSPSKSNYVLRAAAQRTAKEARVREAEEAFRLQTQRKMEEEGARREQQFLGMFDDVLSGMAAEPGGIMGETKYVVEHSQRVRERKKRELHEEWGSQVFDKIQGRLQQQVDARSTAAVERRLSSQMGAYLHTSNTKLGVFRDVIDKAAYDPLSAHDASIRIPTGDILDPLKRDVLKPMYERRLMGDDAPPGPLGKTTLDNKLWGELLIGATPFGHCMDKTGNYKVRPSPDSVLASRQSHIHMDHYVYPTGNAAADLELGRPGKGSRVVPGTRQNGLFAVVQQTGSLAEPDWANGDSWIEYKGRGAPPGPEKRRGRPNLAETFQQTSNPYQDGRTLGDSWLEYKGRALPPGPERRRGRPNLTETFQQTSNPYQDGRTLGDTWLEAKGKRPIEGNPVTIGPVISSTQGLPDPPPSGVHPVRCHLVNDMTLTTRV